MRIEWPTTAKPIQLTLQPVKHILSAQPRLTLRVERDSLFVEDALPRHVEVLIRHAASRLIPPSPGPLLFGAFRPLAGASK